LIEVNRTPHLAGEGASVVRTALCPGNFRKMDEHNQ